MKRSGSILDALAILALALATSAILAGRFARDRILSASADVTYHLQVLDAVRGGGAVPASAKAYMVEMYGYPDFGHRLAAGLTHLGLGDLNALCLVGAFCAALIWFCLFDQARRAGMFVLAVSALLAVASAWTTRASFGAEIVANFFFSQLAGEAFAVAALVVGQPILKRSPIGYALYGAVATFIAAGFHLIPALHVAGAALALLGLQALRGLLAERKLPVALLLGVLAMAAAIVLNPYFAAMSRNSSNDGSVGYAIDMGLPLLGAAELLLLILSGFVLIRRLLAEDEADPAENASAWLAALGAAVAAAGLLQFVVWFGFHQSSPYAIRKEAFGVFSLLCFLVPLAAAELAPALRWPAPVWAPFIAVMAQVSVMGALFHLPAMLDVRGVDRLLANLRAVRAERGLDRTDILYVSAHENRLVSYAVSSAALRRTRDEAAFEVLETGFPLHTDLAKWVAAPAGDLYDKKECRDAKSPSHGLVVVRMACAQPFNLDFRAGHNGAPYLREGWSVPEGGGVWSVGSRSVVELPIPPDARAYELPRLHIGAFAFLTDKSPQRTVRVSIAGGQAEVHVFRKASAHIHVFSVPIGPEAFAGDRLQVVFETLDPVSPQSQGLGDDTRALGVGLERMSILPTLRPVP